MKIIVLPSPPKKSAHAVKGTTKTITLNNGLLLLMSGLVITWVGAISYLLGYELAKQKLPASVASAPAATPSPQLNNTDWQKTLTAQNQQLKSAVQRSQAYLSKITQQVAELQNRQTRVEALAEALSKEAKLSDIFDFSKAPAVGGPERDIEIKPVEELPAQLDQLETAISESADHLNTLASYMNQQHSSHLFVKTAPITKGWLSSDFGRRRDPFTGRQAWHSGIDFAGKAGSPVIAVAPGTITFSGRRSGYGNVIEITHANKMITRYAHCQKLIGKVGDSVKGEQIIATLGSTGRSTGPHLHFEVLKNNQQVNPNLYFRTSPIRKFT